MFVRGQQAGPASFSQTIALSADGDVAAVVEQPIENDGGDDGIVGDGPQFIARPIGGQQDAALLVAAADQLYEDVGGIRFDGEVARVFDAEQL